jgi:general secretion pathway protein D
VPLLGDIPVLGALFRNDDNTTTRTELLVLISPRIIRDTGEARAATQDLERRMHEIRPIAQ